MTTNLFPLPYWAPALQRVPIPLQLLDEAYAHGGTVLPRTRPLGVDLDRRHLRPTLGGPDQDVPGTAMKVGGT